MIHLALAIETISQRNLNIGRIGLQKICAIRLGIYLSIYLSVYLSVYLFINPSFFPSKCVPICHVKTTTNPSNFHAGKVTHISRGTPPYPVGHNWSTPCSVANPGCSKLATFCEDGYAQISCGSHYSTLTFEKKTTPSNKKHVG